MPPHTPLPGPSPSIHPFQDLPPLHLSRITHTVLPGPNPHTYTPSRTQSLYKLPPGPHIYPFHDPIPPPHTPLPGPNPSIPPFQDLPCLRVLPLIDQQRMRPEDELDLTSASVRSGFRRSAASAPSSSSPSPSAPPPAFPSPVPPAVTPGGGMIAGMPPPGRRWGRRGWRRRRMISMVTVRRWGAATAAPPRVSPPSASPASIRVRFGPGSTSPRPMEGTPPHGTPPASSSSTTAVRTPPHPPPASPSPSVGGVPKIGSSPTAAAALLWRGGAHQSGTAGHRR